MRLPILVRCSTVSLTHQGQAGADPGGDSAARDDPRRLERRCIIAESGAQKREQARGVSPGSHGAGPSGILCGLSLLVVDDNDDARQLLKVLFRHCGAHVMVAGSGRDALAMFRVRRPHVVIADLSLPHWDGYRLIREIRSLPREQGGGTPALAVTAFSEVHQDRRAFRAGFDAYLRKPVELRAITDVVRRLGRGAACTAN
jgi:CheY-like chemotaxis protein